MKTPNSIRSTPSLGRDFAEALAGKDHERLAELLHPQVDFRGLTPRRAWAASDASEAVSIVLSQWLEASDHIDELVEVDCAGFADRQRVGYRLRGHNQDGPFLVEQQAYFAESEGRITWMRVVCSGFRPG